MSCLLALLISHRATIRSSYAAAVIYMRAMKNKNKEINIKKARTMRDEMRATTKKTEPTH